ncbi:hypothetical protein UCDDS831_g00475 [Diplodia seriata]|uniref:Uncharacterized protein n=1 Tax=Diplodia seriata TaxID=420778 RepID=A0A0G2HI93_9PEZI|nr:hypothetical protein UCDDS831_g00475 [Diplodia seriata]
MSSAPTPAVLVDYVSAAVQWRCPYDDSLKRLEQASLRIVFDESGMAAHFKLRIPASFKSLRKTHIFLSFAPDRVAELHYTQAPDIPEPVKKTFMSISDPIASLRAVLSQPAGVLVPSETSLTPRNKKFGDVLESVQSLSHCTDFTTLFPVAGDSFHDRASSLCSSIGSLSPIPSELDNASLYNGRGALVLEDCNFGLGPSGAPPRVVESPPSYDELGDLPEPSRPPAAKKLKAKEEPWAVALRELRRELRSDILRELRSDMDARLKKLDESVQAQLRDVSERLEKRVDNQVEDVRQEMQQQVDELEKRIEEVRDEIDDIVDLRLDDQIDSAKSDLRDFVREEVKDAGEDVKRELEGVRLAISYD